MSRNRRFDPALQINRPQQHPPKERRRKTINGAMGQREEHRRQDQRQRRTPPTLEPARDGARIRHLRGAVPHDAEDDEGGVEMPQVRRQQGE